MNVAKLSLVVHTLRLMHYCLFYAQDEIGKETQQYLDWDYGFNFLKDKKWCRSLLGERMTIYDK